MITQRELKNLSAEEIEIRMKSFLKNLKAGIKKKEREAAIKQKRDERKAATAEKLKQRKAENNIKFVIGGVVLAAIRDNRQLSAAQALAEAHSYLAEQEKQRQERREARKNAPVCGCGKKMQGIKQHDKYIWHCPDKAVPPIDRHTVNYFGDRAGNRV